MPVEGLGFPWCALWGGKLHIYQPEVQYLIPKSLAGLLSLLVLTQLEGPRSFLVAENPGRGCQGVGSGMSSAFSHSTDGLYNLLGYIIIFFPLVQLYNPNLWKLWEVAFPTVSCLYVTASELVRVPGISQEAQAGVEQLFTHSLFPYFLDYFVLSSVSSFVFAITKSCASPSGAGWVQAAASPCWCRAETLGIPGVPSVLRICSVIFVVEAAEILAGDR